MENQLLRYFCLYIALAACVVNYSYSVDSSHYSVITIPGKASLSCCRQCQIDHILWIKYSCSFSILSNISRKYYVNGSLVLNIPENLCSYYQCYLIRDGFVQIGKLYKISTVRHIGESNVDESPQKLTDVLWNCFSTSSRPQNRRHSLVTWPDNGAHYRCLSKDSSILPYEMVVYKYFRPFFNSVFYVASIDVIEKSSITLPCRNPFDNDTPQSIIWRYNIFTSLSVTTDFEQSQALFDLYKYDIRTADAGLYQCFVITRSNLAIFIYWLRIKRSEKVVKRNAEAPQVDKVKIKQYSNSIKLSWTPPGVKVQRYIFKWGELFPGPSEQIITGTETKFTIPSLKPNTIYFISITADTDVGILKAVLLRVQTKDTSKDVSLPIPVNLKLAGIGDSWAKITWDDRNSNSDIVSPVQPDLFYQIEYYITSASNSQRHYVNTTQTFFTVTNLNPSTTYEVDVRSCIKNSSKCSDWSMVQEFTSQGTKPSDSPQHLTLSLVPLTEISTKSGQEEYKFAVQVSWQPPKKPNGEIKNYLILISADKHLDVADWGERTISGMTLNTVIDKLDHNRYYYFRIKCTNIHGQSPLSPIKIFKTPDKSGRNGGPIITPKDYYDILEINESIFNLNSVELKGQNTIVVPNNSSNSSFTWKNYKWWIIVGCIAGLTLLFITLFLVLIKCRSAAFDNEISRNKNTKCPLKYTDISNDQVKFVSKGPLLTTPDLFRHTNDQNCRLDYMERTDSPNSFSSTKGFGGLGQNQSFMNRDKYRKINEKFTPPGLIHQSNVTMTTSQLTTNSNDRQFYQVPFIHHMGPTSVNVFTNSAPRVNAAASDFNSTNLHSMSDFSDLNSSQATVLYDTSTAKSSGGKSSLSGSGSYTNGLGNKILSVNGPVNDAINKSVIYNESKEPLAESDVTKAFSSEELCQEMANLEGLMKDLNNITEKEFEC